MYLMSAGAGDGLSATRGKELDGQELGELPTDNNIETVLSVGNTSVRVDPRETSNARKHAGRPLKALTFTRERANSCGSNSSIRDYLDVTGSNSGSKSDCKRKRAALQDSESPPGESAADPANTPNRAIKLQRMTSPPKPVTLDRLLEELTKLRGENSSKLEKLDQQLSAYQQKNEEGLRELRDELKNIEASTDRKWKETTEKLGDMEKRISTLKEAPLSEVAEARLTKIEETVSNIKGVEHLAQTMNQLSRLQGLIDKQEKSIKRNQVIMRGFKTRTDNAPVEVKEFFRSKFELMEDGIDQVSQFGKEGRLIMIKFASYLIKEAIMQRKGQVLKETSISIQNDLSHRELESRNHLLDIAKAEQVKGRTAKVVGNKILLDNDWLVWDKEKEALTPARRQPRRNTSQAKHRRSRRNPPGENEQPESSSTQLSQSSKN